MGLGVQGLGLCMCAFGFGGKCKFSFLIRGWCVGGFIASWFSGLLELSSWGIGLGFEVVGLQITWWKVNVIEGDG